MTDPKPFQAQPADDPQHAATRAAAKRIDRVNDWLNVGGALSPEEYKRFQEAGITHVVDLREESLSDGQLLEELGIVCRHVRCRIAVRRRSTNSSKLRVGSPGVLGSMCTAKAVSGVRRQWPSDCSFCRGAHWTTPWNRSARHVPRCGSTRINSRGCASSRSGFKTRRLGSDWARFRGPRCKTAFDLPRGSSSMSRACRSVRR
jgi:hypothetical protein